MTYTISSPSRKDRWYATAAQWAGYRQAFIDYVYPSGIPTGLPDTIETGYAGFTRPTGCKSMTRFTFSSPGGRSGGTPLYMYLLEPDVASPKNYCSCWYGGHLAPISLEGRSWDTTYCLTDGSSMILRSLAEGWWVLAADAPYSGRQPFPRQIVINGALTTVVSNQYQPLGADGGPKGERMFLDHLIMALNQLQFDHPSMVFGCSGHSGGAVASTEIGMVDDRYVHISPIHNMFPNCAHNGTSEGGKGDWKFAVRANPMFVYGGYDPAGMIALSAACPGRRTLLNQGATDQTFPVKDWRKFWAWVDATNENLGVVGSSIALYTEQANYDHEVSPGEITNLIADIKAHVPNT